MALLLSVPSVRPPATAALLAQFWCYRLSPVGEVVAQPALWPPSASFLKLPCSRSSTR